MSRLVALAVAAAALAAPAAGQRAPIRIDGAVVLRPVDFAADCLRVDAADAKVVECAERGAFRGTPARGTAAYTWHWHLFHGGDAPHTAHGDEDGIAVVGLGVRGTLRLTLRGTKGSGSTTGTWRVASGTRQFARRSGSGTYRFTTTPSANGFRTARLVLRGTLR